jgi:N-acetyl-anhydromuramyl-L-alanine amidase AmpD
MVRSILVSAFALACVLLSSTAAFASPPPYYPEVEWVPAAANNYDAGRSAPISTIVIHETDGSWTSAINWFRNPRARVSSHYLVRAWGGGILQFVAEADTAFHARNANPWTIGIEHEFYPRQGIWHTDAQYRSSAALVCAVARRYGIPIDRQHIVGHNELPDATHGDPGSTWNWSYYMSLVRGCSEQRAKVIARGLRTVADPPASRPRTSAMRSCCSSGISPTWHSSSPTKCARAARDTGRSRRPPLPPFRHRWASP